jgi:CRP-like cAMP-binding protein
LIDLIGIRGALAFGGALLAGVALVIYPRLTRVDGHTSVPGAALAAVATVPLFEPLPPISLEKLARSATRETVPAGTEIIAQGQVADSFYVVVEGTVEVSSGGHRLRTLDQGGFFGEIALLHDVRRTATVSAITDTDVLVIRRIDFLSAVLGNPESASAVEDTIAARLRPEPAHVEPALST